MTAPSQRLIVLFDGTWNDPEDYTNVYRLSRNIVDFDGPIRQRFFYDPGVGTSPLMRLPGGALGLGLSKNLRQGYDWLVHRYTEGSDIYIFGFSRGAFTARSLAGMIRKCGLLHTSTPALMDRAEKLYRDREIAPDDKKAVDFRDRYSREVTIHMLGVWDTVAALGIRGTPLSEAGKFAWHDTTLSSIVKHAYHALALDEHRAAYDCVYWTGPVKPAQEEVEQRWFIGAHANVGGGYNPNPLADPPYLWMEKKAIARGLVLKPVVPLKDPHLTEPDDSYALFLNGLYARYRKLRHGDEGRFHRRYDHDAHGAPATNITVDPSVWARWAAVPEYRPETLTRANIGPP